MWTAREPWQLPWRVPFIGRDRVAAKQPPSFQHGKRSIEALSNAAVGAGSFHRGNGGELQLSGSATEHFELEPVAPTLLDDDHVRHTSARAKAIGLR
jgi:hypothetical protein